MAYDSGEEGTRTPPFKPMNLARLTDDSSQASPTAVVRQMSSLTLTPTTMIACPRSTIQPNGPQFGAVFGQQSSGGKGSLSYDDADHASDNGDETVGETKPVDLLTSPRQTQAPPGTPQCSDLDDFYWQPGGNVAGKRRSATAAAPAILWGLPYSDTFGTLRAIESYDIVESLKHGEHDDEEEDDQEGNKENRPPAHGTTKSDIHRRNSFFSFHLSSSLIRASKKLKGRNSIGGTEEQR